MIPRRKLIAPGNTRPWLACAPSIVAVLAGSAYLLKSGSDHRAFAVLMLVAGGLWLARLDRWAGYFLAYCALLTLTTPSEQRGLVAVQLFALGLLAYALVLTAPPQRWWRPALVGLGLLETGYSLAQLAGFDRPPALETFRATGLLGNPNWAGSLIALTGVLAPPVLLPLFAAGLFATGHRLGAIAFAAGLLWRWRAHWAWTVPSAAAMAGLAGLAWTLNHDAIGSADSLINRGAAWGYGLTLWLHNGVVLGLGPNGWATYMPSYQFALGQPGGLFLHAHNEPLQVLVETGLVGLALLGAWIWAHRGIWATSWGPGCVALSVLALGMFPLRVPALGLVAAVVVGCAAREQAG